MLAWLDEASVDKRSSIMHLLQAGICREGANDLSSLHLGGCIEDRVNRPIHALEILPQRIIFIIKYIFKKLFSILIIACHKYRSKLISPQHLVYFPIRECSKYEWIPIRVLVDHVLEFIILFI